MLYSTLILFRQFPKVASPSTQGPDNRAQVIALWLYRPSMAVSVGSMGDVNTHPEGGRVRMARPSGRGLLRARTPSPLVAPGTHR